MLKGSSNVKNDPLLTANNVIITISLENPLVFVHSAPHMKILFLALLSLSSFSFANDGLTIPNSFQVDRSGNVFRGKEPKKQITELAQLGITDVIIFKNDVRGEVVQEIAGLQQLGIKTYHIPFRWKEYPSMVEACEQTVDALNIIQVVKSKGGKVFFHCTAGEDRTGMLAGLYRMLEERLNTQTIFTTEMCPRGYSDGNPNKPLLVSSAIEKELTPLFLALSAKIERGEWRYGKLINKATCRNLRVVPTNLKCH